MWQYQGNTTSGDMLEHSGVIGMKWGKRTARTYAKTLNSMDKKATKQISNYMKSNEKGYKQLNNGDKYVSKHDANPSKRNGIVLQKMTSKMNQAGAKRKIAFDSARQIDSNTNKLIAEALDKGYSIRSKNVIRNAEIGRQIATQFAIGIIGLSSVNLIRQKAIYKKKYTTTMRNGKTVHQTPFMVVGNKYKVTKGSGDGKPGSLMMR